MGEKHQVALPKLISALTNQPVWTYLEFSKDFILHVDSSKNNLSSALYQQHQDRMRVIWQ